MVAQRRVTEAAKQQLQHHAGRITAGQSDASALQEELTAHLEDATLLLMDREGLSEAAAARQAISRFGGAEQIAEALASVHGTRVSWPRLLTAMALFVALNYCWILVAASLPMRRWMILGVILATFLPQCYILRLDDEVWDTGRLPRVVSALWEHRRLLWPVVGVAWLILPSVWLATGLGQMIAPPLGAEVFGGQVVSLFFLYIFTAAWLRFCGLDGRRGFLLWSSIVLAPLMLLTLVQRSPLDGSFVWPVMLDTLSNIVFIVFAWLLAWLNSRVRENSRPISLRMPAGE
jgi:hypothetical protein